MLGDFFMVASIVHALTPKRKHNPFLPFKPANALTLKVELSSSEQHRLIYTYNVQSVKRHEACRRKSIPFSCALIKGPNRGCFLLLVRLRQRTFACARRPCLQLHRSSHLITNAGWEALVPQLLWFSEVLLSRMTRFCIHLHTSGTTKARFLHSTMPRFAVDTRCTPKYAPRAIA